MTFELYEDIGPSPELAHTVRDLQPGEDVEIRINSCGGDVFGGMGIVATINTLRANGHRTRAIVEGLAASMASVVACACDEIRMHEGSMLMIHNPWTLIEGDASALAKQADIMEKMKTSMIAVYQNHFDLSTEEIARMMDEETWISTDELAQYKLDATVIEGTSRIAASVSKSMYYAHVRGRVKGHLMIEDEDEKQKPDGEKTEDTPVEEQPVEEQTEETVEKLRERIAELTRENEDLRKQLDAPVEDRVRGMQSKMQARINAQTKEFENQLRAKTEELTNAQASVTSLRADLEKAKGELQMTASALEDRTNALATLNAGVLTPHAPEPTPRTRDEARRALARLPMDKRVDYYRKHRALIDG